MQISFTRVTWYSQIAAIVLYVGVFVLAFYIGEYAVASFAPTENSVALATSGTPAVPAQTDYYAPKTGNDSVVVNAVTFACTNPANSFVSADFYSDRVHLMLSDGRAFFLPQTISADGARYGNGDKSGKGENFVFWNKGNTAFIQEQGNTTYDGCVEK